MKLDERRVSVLEKLLDRPGKRWSVSELAEASGVSQPTTSRIVGELEEEGIVFSERKGNMKLVELEKRSYVKGVLRAFSDVHVQMVEVAEDFADKVSQIEEVEKVILFGSVARGTADLESDIDVLVVVSNENVRERVMLKAESVSRESGFHVSPTVMRFEDYREHERERSQFFKSVSQDEVVLYDQ